MTGKNVGDEIEQPTLLPVDLQFQAVLARKAISIPEKKAESNNISRIINTEVIIRNDRYFLRESVEFSGRSPVSAGPV